jgi:HK97 family phage major capsid protein
MNRFERRRKAIEQSMLEHVEAYKGIYKKAEDEDRDPNNDERLEIEEHHRAIETLKEEREGVDENIKTLKGVDDLGREIGAIEPIIDARVTLDRQDNMIQGVAKSLGEIFTESDGFKKVQEAYKSAGRLPQGVSTGAVPMEMYKGTLLETAVGGGLSLAAPVPQVVPGVVDKLFQRLTVADLLLSGQATTNSLRYVVEGTATSGAAGVAEAATKPQSTLGFTLTDEPVKKIATLLPISEEMLEDAPAVQSYINGRLSLFVRIEEERQIVRGAGTNDLVGIMAAARGINVYAGGTAAGNKAVQLFKAMNGQRGSALIEPDFIVINPTDWEALRLLTDTAGQFFGGGPFQGPYGSGSNQAASGQVTGANDSIWGKPTIVTSVLGAGTALIGTSSAAQVWRRGSLSVEASNSHANYFAENLVAIRAEERLALAVYRPAAFTDVRLS